MYHFFVIIILLSFVLWGRMYKKGLIHKYWLSVIIPILIYSLIYGLREGWGVDFNNYKDIFIFSKDTDWGLSVVNSFVQSLGLNYSFAFIVYSIILSTGFFFIIKGYKNEAIYILPLFWVYSFSAVSLIRYWVSIGWVLISLYYFLQKKYVPFILFFILSVSTHMSMMVLLPIILLCNIKDWFNNKMVVMIIYLLATIFLDKGVLGEKLVKPFAEFASLYISNDRLNFYNENADFWFSGERVLAISSNPLFEIIHRIRNGITNFIILYLGFEVKNKYRNGIFFYNLTAIGLIFFNCVQGFELLNRYVAFLCMFSSFILAFIIDYQKKIHFIKNKFIFYILILFCYINLFYRPLFGIETLLYFTTWVWNK